MRAVSASSNFSASLRRCSWRSGASSEAPAGAGSAGISDTAGADALAPPSTGQILTCCKPRLSRARASKRRSAEPPRRRIPGAQSSSTSCAERGRSRSRIGRVSHSSQCTLRGGPTQGLAPRKGRREARDPEKSGRPPPSTRRAVTTRSSATSKTDRAAAAANVVTDTELGVASTTALPASPAVCAVFEEEAIVANPRRSRWSMYTFTSSARSHESKKYESLKIESAGMPLEEEFPGDTAMARARSRDFAAHVRTATAKNSSTRESLRTSERLTTP